MERTLLLWMLALTGSIAQAQTPFANVYEAPSDTTSVWYNGGRVALRPDSGFTVLGSARFNSPDPKIIYVDRIDADGSPLRHDRYRFAQDTVFLYSASASSTAGSLLVGELDRNAFLMRVADDGTPVSAIAYDDPDPLMTRNQWFKAVPLPDDSLLLVGRASFFPSKALFAKSDTNGRVSRGDYLIINNLPTAFLGAAPLANGDVLAWGGAGTLLGGAIQTTSYENIARIAPDGTVLWAERVQGSLTSNLFASGAVELSDGTLRIGLSYRPAGQNNILPSVLALESDGSLIYWKVYPDIVCNVGGAIPANNDGMLMVGSGQGALRFLSVDATGAIVSAGELSATMSQQAFIADASGAPVISGLTPTVPFRHIMIRGTGAFAACGVVPLTSTVQSLTPTIDDDWVRTTVVFDTVDVTASITHSTWLLTDSALCPGIITGSTDHMQRTGKAWPVPASDVLWVDLPEGTTARGVDVIDALGRRAAKGWTVDAGRVRLSVDDLRPGAYTLRIRSIEGDLSVRFLKE
ncbi:MAG: T9SS type A sorting domain-containing protein [Flavobacteriales bacterium]|nr:T9SS type A sorting domain-containing protein [Flavobacteriales bacterium]